MAVLERFLKYVAFDTTSDPKNKTIPSTPRQKELGAFLVREMQSMGIEEARMDEYGYVYGSIAGNVDAVKIGLIAHMDTSDAVSGADIKARIIKNYDGKDIRLNDTVVTSVETFPQLAKYEGKTLVVTDGNTLLGADDKAGIAVILEAMKRLIDDPSIEHGPVKIAFTPDEEIGRGTLKFDVKGFDCKFAYTVDGGKPSEYEYENFNAASAEVVVYGRSTHPGGAKDKMINAINVAMEFHQLLPFDKRPEHTTGYEGFNHLMEISGDVEQAKLTYIIRNHDERKFQSQKDWFLEVATLLNKKYPADTVAVTLTDSYFNMKKEFADKMYIVDLAKSGIEELGMQPKSVAIRGGTDGAQLSYKGLPCPNLGAGGQIFHSRHEFCCVEDMEKSIELLVRIIQKAAQIKE